jgi:hypothetical protein
MGALTLTIEPDEFLGLSALVELDGAPDDGDTDAAAVAKAKTLLRSAVSDKLEAAGLPWAPTAEAAKERAAEAAGSTSTLARFLANDKVRKYGGSVVAVAFLVVLAGGYGPGWPWTGFQQNNQLWDWLHLLLLPVVLGTLPIWIQAREYIGRTRRVIYAVFIVAWIGFVIAGYLVPLGWTGFRGNTLWDWFNLLLLPIALTSIRLLRSKGLRPWRYQKHTMAAVSAGWIITVIGGYGLQWNWTGYPGNTLWDWLQLLLVPLVFPTILLPALIKWVSGDAARRARQAREKAMTPTAAVAGQVGHLAVTRVRSGKF